MLAAHLERGDHVEFTAFDRNPRTGGDTVAKTDIDPSVVMAQRQGAFALDALIANGGTPARTDRQSVAMEGVA